jgi:hypothetical protein
MGAFDPGGLLTYASNPHDVGLGEFVTGTFPVTFEYPERGHVSNYSRALSDWYRFRWVLAVGLAGAGIVAWLRRKSSGPGPGVLVLYVLVSLILIGLTSYTSPRLAFPVEIAAIIVTVWAVDVSLRARRPVSAPAAVRL